MTNHYAFGAYKMKVRSTTSFNDHPLLWPQVVLQVPHIIQILTRLWASKTLIINFLRGMVQENASFLSILETFPLGLATSCQTLKKFDNLGQTPFLRFHLKEKKLS
ncbi:hypothetical protein PanWU01x14_271870 [Parasponia andersonii]|uniref:Uncharacterized protein n=1 Tax=Parasponia andersonii TaxID=3476 RepID=A0A2P5B4L7_PARAD|nr:hypothetical protein PanWU01x14_271870 [Parasponia andersonii]